MTVRYSLEFAVYSLLTLSKLEFAVYSLLRQGVKQTGKQTNKIDRYVKLADVNRAQSSKATRARGG